MDDPKAFMDVYPFVVLGDGLVGKARLAHKLRLLGKVPVPVPHFVFAKSVEHAQEIADGMKVDNRMLLILRTEEVVQWFPPSSS